MTWVTMVLRIASAIVLVPLALFAIYAGGWLFLGLLVILAWLLSAEWVRVMAPANMRFFTLSIAGAVTAGLFLTCFGYLLPGLVVLVAAAVTVGLLALGAEMKARWLVAGIFYIGLGLLAAEWIREALPPPEGRNILFLIAAIIWLTDTGALLIGMLLGGPKLAPDISPKKTWSGALGGLAAGIIAGGLLTPLLLGLPAGLGVFIGAGASVLGQLGDLFESGIKRRFGIKDFGTLIPGHGGAFDRLDSLLFLLPFVAIGCVFALGGSLW